MTNNTAKSKEKPKGTPTGKKPHGGQKGNRNSIRHGLKAGKLPKDAQYIEVRLNVFRRNLEDAVMQAWGEVTLECAAAIQTALRWERHAALCQRWLTKEEKKLTLDQKITYSREIARASAERDKAIAFLELDNDEETDLIDALYSRKPLIDANGGNDK